jgi:tetratricopeptide (TPR) repeat protein
MPRLHLITYFFVFGITSVWGQTKIGTYIKHAEDKFKQGDYVYALELYENAMQIDSNAISLLWDYAETLKAYKDYRKAEYYYGKVFENENGLIYPYSLLNYGLMQKQNGKYEAAYKTFKKVKSLNNSNKKDYLYRKAVQEIEACSWAQNVTIQNDSINLYQLPAPVNSSDSEFGHLVRDGAIIFSSLRADSINSNEEVYANNYKTSLYSSQYSAVDYKESIKLNSLSVNGKNSGNGSYSLDGKRFYFSTCDENQFNYTCKIMVADVEDGNWINIDSLGEIINKVGSNTTMPNVGNVDGREILFFSSDRNGGQGGMDIWYSEIKNGNQYSEPQNITTINSIDNELSPWWDASLKELYFSSNWHIGLGGYDIFKSSYLMEDYSKPINLELPFNSPANDLYFFKYQDTSYFSSNRLGVNYSKNPTCCSDIFRVTYPPKKLPKKISIIIPSRIETLYELSKRLPVTLYFHNDCPNPKSQDTVTKINYMTGYKEYRAMLEQYQIEYTKGMSDENASIAKEELQAFFTNNVDKGVADLELFRDLLLKELETGAQINVTVKGFASPLAKTSYNVKLTKRRISSLVNYLKEYNGGIFEPYISGTAKNGGKVVFTMVPFGEYTANKSTSDDYYDQRNSVYSKAAAIERKVEIQSITYMENNKIFPLSAAQTIYDAGKIDKEIRFEKEFILQNLTGQLVEIDSVYSIFDNIKVIQSSSAIPSKKTSGVTIQIDPSKMEGLTMQYIEVKVKGFTETLKLIVTYEAN